MKAHPNYLALIITFFLLIPVLSWSQNPILRSTTASTPPLSGVTSSLMTESGAFIGLGTTTPSQRLTLKYHQEVLYIGGVPSQTINRGPVIRFEYTSTDLPVTTTYWHLAGTTSFAIYNPTANITPLSIAADGEITLMPKVQMNVNSLNSGNNNNFLGFDMSSNTQRRIYWTSRVGGTDDKTVPLEFMYDARQSGATDVSVMKLMPSGQVRIGDAHTLYQNYVLGSAPNTNAAVRLTVEGNVAAQGFIATQQNWADFVFYEPQHNPTLADEEVSIKQHCTLVGVPNETEVASGRSLADNDALLLQKLEQLYLHVIALDKQLSELQKENLGLKALLKP